MVTDGEEQENGKKYENKTKTVFVLLLVFSLHLLTRTSTNTTEMAEADRIKAETNKRAAGD